MWQVLVYDGNYILDATSDNNLISGNIVEGVNEFASFTFTILPGSIAYDHIHPLNTHVAVMEGTRTKYYGRVLTETPSMEQSGLVQKEIVCEDRMAYLCDSIQPYSVEKQYDGDASRTGLQEFIDVVLANHNSQVEAYKQIHRGNVTVTTHAGSNGVYKGLNYESTWDVLKSKIIDVFGGEMCVRESDGLLYLDYKPSLGATRSTTIEVTKNMISGSQKLDPENVVSRLIPLGAKLTVQTYDEQGNPREQETEERLTIADVQTPQGQIFVENTAAKNLYGIQYKTIVWDDVHDPLILLQRGIDYMANQNKALATHSVSALDLSYVGEAIDEFKLYDKFRVKNTIIGINDTLEIIKKNTDIFSPYNPSLTFGDKEVNLSDIVSGNMTTIADATSNISKTETSIKNEIGNVYTYVQDTATSIQQSTENLIATVESNVVQRSEYDEFSETVRNILEMDSDGTTMIFQTILEAIQTVDDTQESNYEEILKYIRFEDGTITIGVVGNQISLKLENDILGFYQNGIQVAYMSNNKLYITDGQFLNSLRIGKFAFEPRDNGNLSFSKVGD